MTTRPIGLSTTQVSAVRILGGTLAGPDPVPWTDAVLPKVPDPVIGGAVDAAGFATIWLDVEFLGGSGNSVEVALLVRDDGAPDGQRWKRMLSGGAPQTLTLTGAGFVEAVVDGRLVFPCVVAVQGAPAQITLLAIPGTRMPGLPAD